MTILPKSPAQRKLLLLTLAAGLAVRAAFCWFFPQWGPGGSIPDISWYETFAESLLREGSMINSYGQLSATREPGYSALLAAVYSVTGPSYRAAQAVNCVLGTLTLLLIFSLGLSVFGTRTAWLALLAGAFHPQFIYYTTSLEREIFQVFLMTLSLWTLLWTIRKPSARRFFAAGAVTASVALTNSALLPTGMLFAAGIWPLAGTGKKFRAGAALFLAAFVLVYGPWPLRNFVQFDRFILGINGGGAHIYIGMIVPNDVAGTPAEEAFIHNDAVAMKAGELDESERDAYFYRAALKWIKRHPADYMRVMAGSLMKLWRPHPYERSYSFNYTMIKWAAFLSDGWIIPLGFLGIFLAGRRRYPGTDFFNLALFGVSFTYMIFWSIIRYRLPMMPIMILYGAFSLDTLADRFLPGPKRSR